MTMHILTSVGGLVGGIFFAAAFPGPSAMIRSGVGKGASWLRNLLPGKSAD